MKKIIFIAAALLQLGAVAHAGEPGDVICDTVTYSGVFAVKGNQNPPKERLLEGFKAYGNRDTGALLIKRDGFPLALIADPNQAYSGFPNSIGHKDCVVHMNGSISSFICMDASGAGIKGSTRFATPYKNHSVDVLKIFYKANSVEEVTKDGVLSETFTASNCRYAN